jgi:hypothetical protein
MVTLYIKMHYSIGYCTGVSDPDRIHSGDVDPDTDSDPRSSKLLLKKRGDIMFWNAETSLVAWKSFMKKILYENLILVILVILIRIRIQIQQMVYRTYIHLKNIHLQPPIHNWPIASGLWSLVQIIPIYFIGNSNGFMQITVGRQSLVMGNTEWFGI